MLLNQDRIYRVMKKKGLDALIASSPVNIQYLTDIPRLRGYAVLPFEKDIDPFLITGINRNGVVLDSNTWIKDIRFRGAAYYWTYDPEVGLELNDLEKKMKSNYDSAIMDIVEPLPNFITPASRKELKKGLQERGINGGKIGIEEETTTIKEYEKIRKLLPKADLVFADDVFNYAKQVKTRDELKLFEKSVPIVDEGWKAICEASKPGVTEGELLKAYKIAVSSYGTEGAGVPYNLHLSIGRRNIMTTSSGEHRSAKLKKGDLITFNGGITYKNHPAHHARTAVLGEPKNPKVNSYFEAIYNAENAGLDILKPRVKASEVYNIMIDEVKKTIPHFKRHHTGHALGLGYGYDTPNFMSNDHTPLEEGMVFNIEMIHLEFGLGGLRLEDTLVITKSGNKLFTTTDRNIWRL